jgi:hypothetical protein
VAKDNDESNTPAPARLDLLSLNQAVALIVRLLSPHDADAVQTAIGNALTNGTLRDWGGVGDGFSQFGSTDPNTWRHWLDHDRLNWRTGEVRFPKQISRRGNLIEPPPIRPLFRRQDAFELFGITEAPAATDPIEAPVTTDPIEAPAATVATADRPISTAQWIANEAKRLKIENKIPDRITPFAKLLEKRMLEAAKTNKKLRPVRWPHIKNELPGWGLWPPSLIKS